MIGKNKRKNGTNATDTEELNGRVERDLEELDELDDLDEAEDLDELDELMDRYIWDEETGVLYEVSEPERRERSFPRYAALGLLGVLFVSALVFAALKGVSFLPEECYGGESILSENEAALATEQNITALPAAQSDASGEDAPEAAAQYVPASIVIGGRVRGTLASTEAAYALLEDVKSYFDDRVQAEGERTVEFAEEIEVVPKPGAAKADMQSYDELYASFTSSGTPVRVKTTVLTTETSAVGYEQKTEKDKYLVEGTRIIMTAGREGSETVITRNVYINGERSSSRSSSETQVVKAQDMLVRAGSQKVTDKASPGRHEGDKGKDAGELTFVSPISGSVESNYGQRNGVLHLGLDYKIESSADVVASCAGTVVCAMERGGYGLMIEIDHGNGFVTRYAHLAGLNVELGDAVKQGDVIATAGSSGNADNVLLHFELRIDGEAYNPRYYLD